MSEATAIRGARIVQAPGRVIESGTIVIRNGVIESVGRRVDIPYDARIIDGDSLTVYAGFIDALTNVGVPESDDDNPTGSVPDRSNPTFERAGIAPQKDVRMHLDASDKSVASHRQRGFTAALAAPRGRMLPGQTSLVLLTGDKASDMVLPGTRPVLFEFEGAQGVYPGTPMGMMAQFRQLYREADRRMGVQAMYDANPSGLSRPPYDEVHAAFFSVIEGDTPIISFTSDALELRRALSLSDELGFNLMAAGLNQGFDVMDELMSRGIPTIVTLDIPDRPDWAAKADQDSLDQVLASYNDDTRTATFRDIEAEKRNLEAKQLVARTEFLTMPARFAEAGIPFAFTTYGLSVNVMRRNMMEYIANGLSKDDALSALTVDAAAILGLSNVMGSLDAGKMANLVVTDGNYFDKDSKVTMVFVDGNQHLIHECPRGDRSCPDKFTWGN